jgi:hypothetical protein
MGKVWRTIAAAAITLIGVAVIAYSGSRASSNDYTEYWSAGKLFVKHANPYSGPMILALEKSQGFTPDAPLIMLNPPWELLLVAPLGFCAALPGLFLWMLMCAGCLAASVWLLDVPVKFRTLAFLFAPVIAGFSMEQSSPFLLLGFALFLRFNQSRPFLAGASLYLMSIKPHLFLVFWALLLCDCIYRRRFKILAGLAAAMGCASALVTLVTPHVWVDYLALIRGSTLAQQSFPTLPMLLRALIDQKLGWLALVPSCLAIAWGVAYYWSRRAGWDWRRNGMLVMLVTILTSPYSWVSDGVVLLPAVVSALEFRPRRFSMELLIALNCAVLLFFCLNTSVIIWIPVAWFGWYLYAAGWKSGRNYEGSDTQVQRQGGLQEFS